MSLAEIKSNVITVSYDDLMRSNENYVGKIIYYRGKIIQVREDYNDEYTLRVATKESEYVGYSDNIIWVNYKGKRLLEDDIIDVWGKVKGLKSYTGLLGDQVTIPEIDSLNVELSQKSNGEVVAVNSKVPTPTNYVPTNNIVTASNSGVVTKGGILDIGYGYTLKVIDIDSNGNPKTALFELDMDGTKVNSVALQEGQTYRFGSGFSIKMESISDAGVVFNDT